MTSIFLSMQCYVTFPIITINWVNGAEKMCRILGWQIKTQQKAVFVFSHSSDLMILAKLMGKETHRDIVWHCCRHQEHKQQITGHPSSFLKRYMMTIINVNLDLLLVHVLSQKVHRILNFLTIVFSLEKFRVDFGWYPLSLKSSLNDRVWKMILNRNQYPETAPFLTCSM